MALRFLLPLVLVAVASALERHHPTVAEAHPQHKGKHHHHHHGDAYAIHPSAKISLVDDDGSDESTMVRREHRHAPQRDVLVPGGMSLVSDPSDTVASADPLPQVDNSAGITATYDEAAPGAQNAATFSHADTVFAHSAVAGSNNTDAVQGEQGAASLHEAELEAEKVGAMIKGSEREAGLPDTTDTTPEPLSSEDEDKMEEETMLMIIAIGLVVLVIVWCVGWVVVYTKFGETTTKVVGGAESETEALTAED